MGIDLNVFLVAFKKDLLFYFETLKNFEFSYRNPLFWVSLLLLILILMRIWEARKSFSFCTLLAIILLATTRLENFIVVTFAKYGESIDTSIVRLVSIFIVAMIFLIYVFLGR